LPGEYSQKAGGTIYPLDQMRAIRSLADKHGIPVHLDGARLWNASVATGIPVRDFASLCDTVSVCFSKGLGAPVGSALAGPKELVQRARTFRKVIGGGMRQAGILAAAALYALDHNIARLGEDHANARYLAESVSHIASLRVDLETVQTNIIMIDVSATGKPLDAILDALQARGVLLSDGGPTILRAVTHLDVSRDQVEATVKVFQQIFS